jgi:ABC-type multidrug transport system permease subunit
MVFLAPEVALLLLFAVFAFAVPIRGSLASLSLIILLGGLSFSGLGLLVASRARTVEAVSGLTNLILLPMWLLSGVFFSNSRFPDAVQPLIQALPLTAQIDAMRAVMLEGATLAQVGGELAIVTVWGVATYVAALAVFRWE